MAAATGNAQRHRPIQITATTPHGVVLARPWGIALDGLLASVLWQRHKWAAREAGHHLTYHPDQPPEPIDLPLARCGDPNRDADWHWMATFADLHPRDPEVLETDVRWRTSRTNHQRLQHLAPTIGRQAVTDRAGRYQHRIIPVMAHPATTLTWRAVGDPEAIRNLLTDLRSIGKHRDVGEGLVTRWDVATTPDVTRWDAGHTHEPGVLGRTAPARCLAQHPTVATGPPATAPVRPPYLHPQSRAAAYHPAR
jgi:CRISPR type IV-associated protein Csf3